MAAELAVSGVCFLAELAYRKYQDTKELQLKERLGKLAIRVCGVTNLLTNFRGKQDLLLPLKVCAQV